MAGSHKKYLSDPEKVKEFISCAVLECDDGDSVFIGEPGEPTAYEKLCDLLESSQLICDKIQALMLPTSPTSVGCIPGETKSDEPQAAVILADDPQRLIAIYTDGTVEDPYEGEFELCVPGPQYVDSTCVFLSAPDDNPDVCESTAWTCPETPGIFYYLNPETGIYEEMNQPVGKVSGNQLTPEKSDLLNFEFAGPQVGLTFQDLFNNALENGGATWADGTPINPDDFGTLVQPCGGRFNVQVCDGATCITLNDGTEFIATTEKNAVTHYPEGTANGTPYHAGAAGVTIGTDGDDTFDVTEGGGFYGCIQVQQFINKAGEAVDPNAK